jgi:hypothetical protein
MVKKLACVFGLVLAFACSARAADVFFGVESGYTHNELNTSTGYRTFTAYNDRSGWLVGVPVTVPLNEQFALGSGLRYVQKNYSYERDFLNGTVIYSDYSNGFLQFPIFLDFSVPVSKSNFRMFFDAGTTLGFWLHSNRKGVWSGVTGIGENPYDPDYMQLERFNESVEFDGRRDNRFEAALFAGFGVRYVQKRAAPFIAVQYHRGLTDLQKDYMLTQIPRYNNTIMIQTGVLFGRVK